MSTYDPPIESFSDDKLARELAFARGFDMPDPEGVAWLEALEAEQARRHSALDTMVQLIRVVKSGPRRGEILTAADATDLVASVKLHDACIERVIADGDADNPDDAHEFLIDHGEMGDIEEGVYQAAAAIVEELG